jgi:4-aminobutyrate aminotransferase-like enzyme
MATKSTIMDTNSYRDEFADLLPPPERELIQRRAQLLGSAYRLFYRKPVHLVRGRGQYLWDAEGNQYLDVYNNVASVGHAHPRVVEAVNRQMRQLNTHTRYLHEAILDYSERILATMPTAIDTAMYMCTGSEANDLAVRVAQRYTGGEGVIVTREAYHGTSALTSGLSPALGTGQELAVTARTVAAPDAYRSGEAGLAQHFAATIQAQIDDLAEHGIKFAAFLADSIFSSDGVLPNAPGMLGAAIDVVHRNGGVFIADEVQPGFVRTGEAFWGFARHGLTPDLVTTGKPMGNGIPVSAVFAKKEVLAAFGDHIPYFNTFGGNPVSIAAAQAVLDIIEDEQLQAHALTVGSDFLAALRQVAQAHPGAVGDVRGAGLFIGCELVTDLESKTPDKALALDLLEQLRDRRVLTSVAGPFGNVLKLRPPLPFDGTDISWVTEALDASLTALGR